MFIFFTDPLVYWLSICIELGRSLILICLGPIHTKILRNVINCYLCVMLHNLNSYFELCLILPQILIFPTFDYGRNSIRLLDYVCRPL